MPSWSRFLAGRNHGELIHILNHQVVAMDAKSCDVMESNHRVLYDVLADTSLQVNHQLGDSTEVISHLVEHQQLEYLNDRGIRQYLPSTSSSSGALSCDLRSASQVSSP